MERGSRVNHDDGDSVKQNSGKHTHKGGICGESTLAKGRTQDEERLISNYWFMIEREMLKAINKGNTALLPIATARVNYLKNVVNQQLLEEGSRGEEEALCEIQTLMYNGGWWERANKLDARAKGVKLPKSEAQQDKDEQAVLKFIQANECLVHPNLLPLVKKGNNDEIRMALNQIHYGTLRTSREVAQLKSLVQQENINVNAVNLQKVRPQTENYIDSFKADKSNLNCVKDFLANHKNMVAREVLQAAQQGDDKALSLALGIIHHKSLEINKSLGISTEKLKKNKKPDKSYKEALLHKPELSTEVVSPPTSNISSGPVVRDPKTKTIFFTGFKDSTTAKEIWIFFKKAGEIRDIILPRKKDKNNKRYGFVVLKNLVVAGKLIESLNGTHFQEGKIYMSLAKNKSK